VNVINSSASASHFTFPGPIRKKLVRLVIYITDSASAQAHSVVRLVAEGSATDRFGGGVRLSPRGAARG
jgi:hypothetical protein